MKKLFVFAMLMGLVLPGFAIDAIYKGDSTDAKNVVCYVVGSNFYADSARKQLMFNHPGSMVSKEKRTTAKNAIYRTMGDKIYKGSSLKKEDCIATIVETKVQKGNTKEAKIYEGWAIPRDEVKKREKGGITILTSVKVTSDGISKPAGKVLYTIADGKIYKGDSKDAKDCVLTYTGSLTASRLLFVCIELAK